MSELGPRTRDVVEQGRLGKLQWSKALRKPDKVIPVKASSVHVFDRGLVLGDESDGIAEAFRWSDVTDFTKKMVKETIQGPMQVRGHKVQWTRFTFDFKFLDRHVHLFGTTDKRHTSIFETFDGVVGPLVREAQLPGMLAALERGETLEFGLLKVSKAGLSRPAWRKKNQDLAWEDVSTVGLVRGELTIDTRTTTLGLYTTCKVADTPNFDALVEIIRAHMPT